MEKQKFWIPKVSDLDIETIYHCILEFTDVAAAGRLNLTSGPLCYSYFCQCLEDGVRDHWDVVAAGNPQTITGSQASLEAFLPYFLHPTDYADQVNYLNNAPKPFKLTCLQLAAWLQFMNCMIGLFPEVPQNPP